MHTYSSALSLVGVSVPAHLAADADVPVLTGPQAQGDLIVIPVSDPVDVEWETLPSNGIQVIRGEAGENTHWLHPGFDSPGVRWAPTAPPPRPTRQAALALGHVLVPEGQSALLIHTDEHGANGIGPGCYAIHRKRQLRLETPAPAAETSRTGSNPGSTPDSRRSLLGRSDAWNYVYD